MKKIFTIAVILIASYSGLKAQELSDPNVIFNDANIYFNFEDYNEALYLYLDLYKYIPENAHIDYKIGICYLQLPGEKHKALPYLENATKSLTKFFNQYSLLEKKAPYEALFYLGNAYIATNKLEDAKIAYELFEKSINKRKYDLTYLNKQRETLLSSIKLQQTPINYLQRNLGVKINNRFENLNPVISGDLKTMAFTSKLKFYDAIMISRKQADGSWGIPVNISLQLKTDQPVSTLSLSHHGDELYLYRDDNHDGNIYVSYFKDGRWSPIQALNDNINSVYWEAHASVSADGQTLFFSSNRPGGKGDLDLYYSKKTKEGDWGPAKNLGSKINTPFHESTPFLNENGTVLFFSSNGHPNVGGFDIFYSLIDKNGKFNEVQNIGYPLNTTDDEVFFSPYKNGEFALIQKTDEYSFGKHDIYEIEFFSEQYLKAILTKEDDDTSTEIPRTLLIDTINKGNYAIVNPTKSEEKYSEIVKNTNLFQIYFHGEKYQFVPDTFWNGELVVDKIFDTLENNFNIDFESSLLLANNDSLMQIGLLEDSFTISIIPLISENQKTSKNQERKFNIKDADSADMYKEIEEEIASLRASKDKMRDINMSNEDINKFYQHVLIFSNSIDYITKLEELKNNAVNNPEYQTALNSLIKRFKYLKANPKIQDSVILLVLSDYLKLDHDIQKGLLSLIDEINPIETIQAKDIEQDKKIKEEKQPLFWIYILASFLILASAYSFYKRKKK